MGSSKKESLQRNMNQTVVTSGVKVSRLKRTVKYFNVPLLNGFRAIHGK